jgi:hypothetical protein
MNQLTEETDFESLWENCHDSCKIIWKDADKNNYQEKSEF